MPGIKDLLQSLFNRSAVSQTRLEEIMDAVEKKGLTGKSESDLCKLQQFVMNAILAKALADGQASLNDKNRITDINRDYFEREINTLVILGNKTVFTSRMHDWVRERLTAMALSMAREKTYEKLRDVWIDMDDNTRLSFLNYVSKLQVSIFNNAHLNLRQSRLEFKKTGDTSLGYFTFDGPELRTDTTPVITINKDLIGKTTIDMALMTVVHEQMHAILHQMATQRYNHIIPADDPLYKDAGLMLNRIRYDSYISAIFGPGYYADVEEKLCHSAHEQFIPLYREQTARLQNLNDKIGRGPA